MRHVEGASKRLRNLFILLRLVRNILQWFALPATFAMVMALMGWWGGRHPLPVSAAGFAPTQWTYAMPADQCPWGQDDDCNSGSPALADINGDGFDDVIAVTNKGFVVALRHDGVLLWQTDVAPYFNMSPGTNEIHSSPAVADIDTDGFPEIAVGVGSYHPDYCNGGGLIVLNHNGYPEPGWPFIIDDDEIPPDECPDTIFGTPALGDLDKDGDLEITAAGFDKRVYAWHHDGTILPGFPPASNLYKRFPTWQNLSDRLADSTWGSTVLADLDKDGFLDIIVGSGEGNIDDRWGGDSGGWTCPYELPPGWAPGHCGGSLYAFNRFGHILPGFPRYFLEAIGSTPAVADTDGDGELEIYIGLSSFYYDNSPDRPTYGFKLYGLDSQGRDLPGWEGGKDLGGGSSASPSVGDIAGDEELEVVFAATDLKLYAWYNDGSPVAGFPMLPLTQVGQSFLRYEHGVSFPLADYDSDGKMEIFLNQTWTVLVVDGDGQQLTSTNFPADPRPTYYAEGNLFNTPAIGDIDHDGRLELVATNSHVFVWDLPDSTDYAQWPAFKCDAERRGQLCQPRLSVSPSKVIITSPLGEDGQAGYTMRIDYDGKEEIPWTSTAPARFKVFPSSGKITSESPVVVNVSFATDDLHDGYYSLGSVRIAPQSKDLHVLPSTQEVSIFKGDLHKTFFPIFLP